MVQVHPYKTNKRALFHSNKKQQTRKISNIGTAPLIETLEKVLQATYKHIKLDANYDTYIKQLLNENKNKAYIKYKTNLCIVNININTKKGVYQFNIPNKHLLPTDSRIEGIIFVFTNLMKWLKTQRGLNLVLNTAIFIWISDRFIWEIENVDHKLPICLYACPRDKNYIIIPDSTFFIQSLTTRYARKGLTWEQQKRLFATDVKTKRKMFFRGADTTTYIHNLRRYIADRLQTETDKTFKNDIIYEFLTKQNYESVAAFKKYKFMLNLPGHYPWSTRLKYLYLGRHYIINVRVFTYVDDKLFDDHYHSFVDFIVPDDYCINIDMKYHYSPDDAGESAARLASEKNKAECERVYNEIKRIYYEYNNKQPGANKDVLTAYKQMNRLTSVDMYKYYLEIARHNQILGVKPIDIDDYTVGSKILEHPNTTSII